MKTLNLFCMVSYTIKPFNTILCLKIPYWQVWKFKNLLNVFWKQNECTLFASWIYPLSRSAWAAITERHRLSGWNHRHLFPTVLDSRSPKSRSQMIWCLVRTLLLICLVPVSSHGRERELSSPVASLLTRALISFLRALTSWPHRRSHLQIPSHWD